MKIFSLKQSAQETRWWAGMMTYSPHAGCKLRKARAEKLGGSSDSEFVDKLISNAGINVDSNEREELKARVAEKSETRAHLLSALADDPRVIAREKERSLVLIHYFAYLRHNPADPPDKDMSGFEFWVGEVRKHGDTDLATAFSRSIERNNEK